MKTLADIIEHDILIPGFAESVTLAATQAKPKTWPKVKAEPSSIDYNPDLMIAIAGTVRHETPKKIRFLADCVTLGKQTKQVEIVLPKAKIEICEHGIRLPACLLDELETISLPGRLSSFYFKRLAN